MKDRQRRLLQWIKNPNCSIVQKHTLIMKVNALLRDSLIINVFVVMEITQVEGGYFTK
jgi:hypothetical protein